MSEQTKESPRGTNSSFWPREKLPELHLICLQARFFGFTRQPEGFIWCVQQGMNWSLAWILLVTPHHTVIGAALKQTVRERRRKKLLWSCDRRWTEVSLWVDVNVLPDLTPAHAASCSMTFDLSPQLWVAAVWYSDRWRHWWSVPHRVTCDVMMTYTYHQSKRNSDTVLVSLWNNFPSLTLWRSSDTQFCHFSCVQLRAKVCVTDNIWMLHHSNRDTPNTQHPVTELRAHTGTQPAGHCDDWEGSFRNTAQHFHL